MRFLTGFAFATVMLGLLLIVAGLIMATAIHGSRLAMVCPTCREEC
jgi:hypothetical protein